MTPTTKRRFSSKRTGTRKATRRTLLPVLVSCGTCGRERMPHLVCRSCGAAR